MRVSCKKIMVVVLLVSMLLPSITVYGSTNRYDQSGTFDSTGSPLLNPNFTTDQWNKWEIVAWGVFLSNFVVPMADSYESAFSSSSTYGSRGSGFKALNFSQSGDPGARGILENFTQFAVDNASTITKDLVVTYHYVDQVGNIIVPSDPADLDSDAVIVDEAQDPTKKKINVENSSPANFTSILPYNLGDTEANSETRTNLLYNDVSAWIAGTEFGTDAIDDVFGANGVVYRPWVGTTVQYSNLIAIPPSAGGKSKNSNVNRKKTNALVASKSELPAAYASEDTGKSVLEIAVAKLPIIWLEGADGTYEKVWDMLDPWDYQILITMLAKELNSDSEFDSLLGTKKVWEVVQENIDKAFDNQSPLKLDCFGNIITLLDGNPLVVIPAAYNKHLTTKPVVNLVNSLFLTGPTSGIYGKTLLDKGKMPVRGMFWWLSNTNETDRDATSSFGPGMPAFGWTDSSMPNNAVSIYFDSDSLAYMTYKDRVSGGDKFYETALDYGGVKLHPQTTAVLGVLDLDLNGNRSYTRAFKTEDDTTVTSSDLVVPKLTLTGISKASGLGKDEEKYGENQGVNSLMTALTFLDGMTGLLPASYNEVETEYVQQMTWKNVQSDILGEAKVIPVAMQSGTVKGKMSWSGLARDFVSYYGTQYYPANREKELHRLSVLLAGEDGTKKLTTKNLYKDFTQYLMYDADKKASLPLIAHSKTPEMSPYMNVPALGNGAKVLGVDATGFIWTEKDYIKGDSIDTSWFSSATGTILDVGQASMTQRWVKAYPTNPVLANVADYLGMRGDSEFAAAAAPYVYLTYLDTYGVGSVDGSRGVNVSTLNKNPTKFNENIFDAKGSPIFSLNPAANTNIKSDADRARDVSNFTYKLLSPTEGHEYKRQLVSSYIGQGIYESYNTIVYGGSLEYRSGGVQQVVTRSQTGFLRFPSLDDNVFTRWFYDDYATVALYLLAVGLVFIVVLGIFRGRKFTWFLVSTVLLVTSVIVIPFVNDIASKTMDGLVSNILKDKTTIWSMSEMIANSNMEAEFLSADLSAEEAEIAADITKSLSIAYTDRSLMLKQDISHKVLSLGNYAAYQQFASTRWMLPSILRQFTADDGSAAYLYVPLLDVLDDAANAYWWYNPSDATNSGGIAANDLQARYAVGTAEGTTKAEYTYDTIKKFYPDYHWTDTGKVTDTAGNILSGADAETKMKLSYRSISQSLTGTVAGVVPIHDYIYMYMNNAYDSSYTPETATQQVPILNVRIRPVMTEATAKNRLYWGDPAKITPSANSGGAGTYLAGLYLFNQTPTLRSAHNALWHGTQSTSDSTDNGVASALTSTLTYDQANIELLQVAQRYNRDERDTMYGEFSYLWSTETMYPYFYALVKDTMLAMGKYDYQTGNINNQADHANSWDAADARLGLVLNALTGLPKVSKGMTATADLNVFYGASRSNFMYQSGITGADLSVTAPNALLPATASGSNQALFTGYGRDVLDLESVFYNVIPYMYQMTLITGGLTGGENDRGLFGDPRLNTITASQYKTYEGLPQSWMYRSNWATKIVEAPAYNKPEKIGYYVGGKKQYAEVTMTYLPDAYHAVKDGGRDMIFSEAQLRMEGLSENDLTTLELKLIKLNKDVSNKWTKLINYVNVGGMTAEVMCRQMALDAMTTFNAAVTPAGLGNSVYALTPTAVDLRAISFDTLMRVILLNTSKDGNFMGADAMEAVVTEFGMLTGVLLLVTAWICVYLLTTLRAFFLAFIFLLGVYGVARGVFASNASKKATLYGYLTNIGLLFGVSYLYYQVFNILMTGANNTEYVSSGLKGASAAPTIAIIVVLAATCVYIFIMIKMFLIAFGSVVSGSHDLGFGAYKDKAQVGASKLSRKFSELRASHSFEDVGNQVSHIRAGTGSEVTGGSAESTRATKRKHSGSATSVESGSGSGTGSGTGSGARALQGNVSTKGTRNKTALDDYESVDSVIRKGGVESTPSNPALDLDDYLGVPPENSSKPTKK